ncbi:MAG: hypothetical protein BWY85_00433 [Firmicutes bacterium ADurb.Bin506]|nr:MAG: hypothetical protein BWY85_00433 [Firmicutes bacterium ADurb.Bin506]
MTTRSVKRFSAFAMLLVIVVAAAMLLTPEPAAAGSAVVQDYEVFKPEPPISAGMHVVFRRIVARSVTELEWRVTVQKSSYPGPVEIAWVRPRSDGSVPNATLRVLTGLDKGRTFGPVFGIGDPDETEWTAPWVSREVLRELRTGKRAYNFRTGGANLAGLFSGDLLVEEEILYPVEINGNRMYLPAFVTGKGQFTIWNNLANPLVLEYRPLGVPLITGVGGWKAESIWVSGAI